MWKIKDIVINTLLKIRLYFLITFKPDRFKTDRSSVYKRGWELTFNDDFNDGEIDRDIWRTDTYYGSRFHPGNIKTKNIAPDEYLADDHFEFEDSILKQKVTNEPKIVRYIDWDGKDWGEWKIPYRVGKLDSSISFEQQYGYFEIRSKITDQPGHWPAFWLASVHAWPPEIDIYEIYTGKRKGKNMFESNFHWMPEPNKKSKVKGHKMLDASEAFHTYAVEWDKKYFKIYYDNLLVRVYSNPETLEEFKYPMHILISSGVDTNPTRGIKNAKFPTYHEIDYVRAYRRL